MNSKEYFIGNLADFLDINSNASILDLGSGVSKNFLSLLDKFPNIRYVGVEPCEISFKAAKDNLKRYTNIKLYNKLAYDKIENYDSFDICISLSVLEHIKQLERFLINSIKHVKSGGHIIHRYDLGHALYPSSLKERVQVFLGNNVSRILPENKFVRYIKESEICQILEKNGAIIDKITYHQMPGHKSFFKYFDNTGEDALECASRILKWEFDISKYLISMDTKQKELLFPSVMIWAHKK